MKNKIAILLAAYNGEHYIIEQLQSILNQENVVSTIFISLDNSSDGSLDILKKYSLKYPNIILLEYGQRFGSAGQNFFHLIKTVDVGDFDYVAFADQDDIWNDSKLKNAIRMLNETGADGYSSNVIAFWEDGREQLVNKAFPQSEFDYLFESPGPGCTFVFSVNLFISMQDFIRSNYSEINLLWLHDWFSYSFARFNNYKWVIDPCPSMKYRQHSQNEVGANAGFLSFFKRVNAMLNGSGLAYAKSQSKFIGQENTQPMRYLEEGRLGYLKLFFISYKLRRKASHKIFCALFFLAVLIKGTNKKEGVLP